MKKNLFLFSLFFASLLFASLISCSDTSSFDTYKTDKYNLKKNLKLINETIALFNQRGYKDNSELFKAKIAIYKALNLLSSNFESTQLNLLYTLKAHDDDVLFVDWSPDGQYLATCSHDKTVKIWNAENFQLTGVLRHNNSVYNFQWSPDCQKLVSAAHDAINIWDVQNCKLIKQINEHPLRKVLWSADGKYIVSLSFNCKLKLWNCNGEFIRLLDEGYSTTSMCWDADNNLVSARTIVKDYNVYKLAYIWNLENNSCSYIHNKELFDSFYHIDFSNTNLFAIPDYSSRYQKHLIQLSNMQANNVKLLFGHESYIYCVKFSHNGKLLASCDNKVIKIWDLNGNLLQTLQGHTRDITSLSWSPDNTRLASASYDKTVKIWEIQ